MTLGQAKPSFKIEIVLDLLELSRADKKASQEADHQRGHVLVNRILIPLESVDQLLELLLPLLATLPSRFQGRGHLVDVLDVLSDCLLLSLDMLQSPSMQSARRPSCFSANPLFSHPSSRSIDSRTSFKARP